MSASTASEYDLVDYPGHAFPDTHPWRLGAIGILHGMDTAPVAGCRVLDIGCGDAANIIPMAWAFPESTFVGIDLAERPITRGRAAVRALGLDNVTLRACDLMTVGDTFGTFDYIIAHGLYSWVPEAVRDGLLALCGRLLAPNGVAFISYLALPGTRLREMFRDRMFAAASPDDPPATRIARARAAMRLFGAGPASADPFREVCRTLAREVEDLEDGALFHDWLAPCNAALGIRDFVAHAGRHRLAFVGEAEFYMNQYRHDPHVAAAHAELDRLDREDPIGREQLLDDLRFRRFRQTLLCRADVPLRPPAPADLQHLAIASHLKPEGAVEPGDRSVATFASPRDVHIRIDHPLTKAALLELAGAWPGAVPFGALVERAGQRCGGTAAAGDVHATAQALLSCAGAAHAEFYAHPPALSARPGPRPSVSPVARWELAHRPHVTTLRHASLTIEDALGRAFFDLLDGSRDRAALAAALAERGLIEGDVKATLEASLQGLGTAGVLLA